MFPGIPEKAPGCPEMFPGIPEMLPEYPEKPPGYPEKPPGYPGKPPGYPGVGVFRRLKGWGEIIVRGGFGLWGACCIFAAREMFADG
jgi:hypothetical protein